MEKALTLDENDPRVIAARDAEQELFDFYGLEAKTHYITLPGFGIRVRISEIGSGKPVLVVPGNTGDVFPLAPLLAELKGYRIIAVNRPGGGLSEGMDHRTVDIRKFAVETLVAVLDAFSLDSIPVIAHSMGGHWSLWTTMDRPERVESLTLLGVPGNVMSSGAPFMLRLISLPVINRLLFSLINPVNKKNALKPLTFMGHTAETLAVLPGAMADCYYYFRRLPHYRISALSLMERGAPRITPEQLNEIHQPVLMLWGTKDTFGSVGAGRRIANELSASTFVPIEDAGHLPWLDNPAECGRLIRDFLAD
jgi:2-hydroxy-6-oxonona-2,4-dienedioate hydrolase